MCYFCSKLTEIRIHQRIFVEFPYMKFHKIPFHGSHAFTCRKTETKLACGRKDRHKKANRVLLKCFGNLGSRLANGSVCITLPILQNKHGSYAP